MPFFQVNFHKYDKICQILCIVSHAKTCFFLKSVKQKSKFSQTFEWQEMQRRKTHKSYVTTAEQNDPENKTKNVDSGKCYA